ncbi:MAG: hypothetical protein JWN36_245 [Microbacteriaceae bacterium]|nr:hypothetical protein [Microbacteriaceae bacterium]
MNRWGYFEATALGRGAWLRERLTLLPPGTSDSERRTLAFFRNWSVIGAVGALLVMIPLGLALPPLVAFVAAFGVYAAVIWQGARMTRRLRSALVRLVVITVPLSAGVRSYGNVASLRASIAALADLDSRRAALTEPQYEAEWGAIYWELYSHREALGLEVQQGVLDSERR